MATIGGIEIFRPGSKAEFEIRCRAEKNIQSKFGTGRYTDSKQINEILQFQFSYYEKIIESYLPSISNIKFIEFLLAQYDKSAELDSIYKASKLNQKDKNEWDELGPIFRRAIKYLAELVVKKMTKVEYNVPHKTQYQLMEKVWISAEELVRLYALSGQTYSIFPEKTTFEIFPPNSELTWSLEIDFPCRFEWYKNIEIDRVDKEKALPKITFDLDVELQNKYLEQAFKDTLGISYQEAVSIIANIINNSETKGKGLSIPIVEKQYLIDQITNSLKINPETINTILAGFTVKKVNLESEDRVLWKPHQEHRAYRRGFFEVPYNKKLHLIWSKEMAKESQLHLIRHIAFRKLPEEWKNTKTNSALDRVSNEAGKWFEGVVADNLTTLGFVGVKSVKTQIGVGESKLIIPEEVGEIDYIGYSISENLLIVGECKMTNSGLEPKMYQGDISDFVKNKNSYLDKFRKKINWVNSNIDDICMALKSIKLMDFPEKPLKTGGVIITLYSTIASCFVDDYPVVSLQVLKVDYKREGKWPYKFGFVEHS